MPTRFMNGIDATNQRIINVADPSSATDAVNLQYIQNLFLGLGNKRVVDVATTGNVSLAGGGLANGQSIDGVSVTTGMRVLVMAQSSGTENGIYVVPASGAASRATDADATADFAQGLLVAVRQGTNNGDKLFLMTNNTAPTLGSDAITFSGVSGTTVTASTGLTKVGDDIRLDSSAAGAGLGFSSGVLAVNVDSTTLEVSSDTVRISATAAGAGLTGGGGSALAVGAGAGITVNANDVAIDTSVVVRKYSANIGNASLTDIAVTHNLGSSDFTWSVRDTSTNEYVFPTVVATSANVATFSFATAPGNNAFRVTVQV